MEIQENGPWVVSDWRDGRITIQSDDFTFDAALEVSGDFGSPEIKRAYAEEICRRLNTTNPVRIPCEHHIWNRLNDQCKVCGINRAET